ncbi:MAG: peptidylprolyl isomerase [Flavobacteriales bacterium]|nr:peptidylprolyl isomerase [Flavobacteriales bacterium]
MKKIIFTLIFTSITTVFFTQEVIDKVIAVIGEKPILFSDLQNQKIQMMQQGASADDGLDCYLLDEIMLQQLLIHQAEIDSIEVTEDMVKAELDQRIQYFSAQIGGIEKLEEFYDKSIQEIKEEFFEQIEDKMKAQKMQQEITSSVMVSPREVKDFFKSIPNDSIPFINSQVKVSQLVIAPEISNDQKQNTKEKLNKIRTRILSNDISFGVAAEFYSCDPGTKSNNGNFGWVDRGDFVPEFDAIAFSVPIGEVSHVFESPFGYHIVKIEKRRGEQYYGSHILLCTEISESELVNVKEKIKAVKADIDSENKSWNDAIAEFSTDENTRNTNGIIYNESSGEMFWDMQNIDKEIFIGIKNIEIGEFSSPLYYEDAKGNIGYRILKLEERTNPHKANLKDDYQIIQNFALNNKQIEKMTAWITKTSRNTYVKIDENYKTCDSNQKWNIISD